MDAMTQSNAMDPRDPNAIREIRVQKLLRADPSRRRAEPNHSSREQKNARPTPGAAMNS